MPPSLRPHFPSDYTSSALSATSNHQSALSTRKEEITSRNTDSPDPPHSSSPKSANKQPLDIEIVHNSHENEDIGGRSEEINDNSLPISSPMTSKDNSVNDNEIYNCDGPRQDKGKEAIELTSLLITSFKL